MRQCYVFYIAATTMARNLSSDDSARHARVDAAIFGS